MGQKNVLRYHMEVKIQKWFDLSKFDVQDT